MEGAHGSSWADMAPDLLANIFARLSLQHLLVTVPSVCRPWQRASLNPLCYLSLDLCGFSISAILDGFLEHVLLPRTQGRLLHIFFSGHSCSRSSMYLLAESAPLLQTLHAFSCDLDVEWARYAAPLMPHITDLDLSFCSIKMPHLALEAFGQSCRHVLKLRRNLWDEVEGVNDDEALAIAQYYPFLKHLELQCNPLSEQGLEAILRCCPDLEHLDLAGCSHLLNMDSKLLDECHARIKDFAEPGTDDDDCYDYYDVEVSARDAIGGDFDSDDW